jgi:hypothetical protein
VDGRLGGENFSSKLGEFGEEGQGEHVVCVGDEDDVDEGWLGEAELRSMHVQRSGALDEYLACEPFESHRRVRLLLLRRSRFYKEIINLFFSLTDLNFDSR